MRYGKCCFCGRPTTGIHFIDTGRDVCESCVVSEIKWLASRKRVFGADLPFCDSCHEELAESRDYGLGVSTCYVCTHEIPYSQLLTQLLPKAIRWEAPE
jgi:hypothetical protein